MKNRTLLNVVLLTLAAMPGQTIEIQTRPAMPELGYMPTANKHTAKRSKRKAAKLEAKSCKPSEKQHKDRNKKGRP